MTMLDRMRRHRAWLKWSLGFVVATFILLYVPQFLRQNTGAAPSDVIATVGGRKITADTYQRVYTQQVAQLRSTYGDVNDQMLKQLGIGQRLVEQLVNQEAQLAEADRLGITVSDGELKERLVRLPMFQQNGQFIGEPVYRQFLSSQRPPVTPAEFEEDLRRSLVAEKLQAAVTSWLQVSDADVEREYRKQTEKVKVDLAIFTADQFRAGIQPTDAELTAEFTAHPDIYRIPEKRRVRYLSIDASALRAKMTVTAPEVEAKYNENIATYSTPEQVRASHILLKTEGKDEASVRKIAESVLAKVKNGGDFAALAKQYSEDDASKANGGDLDYFGKGSMVKEFDDAVWALKPGEVTDLVKSEFGFHIIKLTDRKPAVTKTLADVRAQLEEQVRTEKAQAEAQRLTEEVAKQIKTPADLDKAAAEKGMTVGDSGLFAKGEPLAGLGFASAVNAAAFGLEQGKTSEALRTDTGYAFIAVTEVKPPAAPALADVKDRVIDSVVRAKAVEIARSKGTAMADAAHKNFDAAAKAAGVDVKSTDFVLRGSAFPLVGVSDKIDNAIFAMKRGESSDAIVTDTAVVVARVKEREDMTQAGLDTQRDTVRQQLLQRLRGQFFDAYMTKARTKIPVLYNQNTIASVTGA
ncbi:MAG: peptidylprolyl isomerase [Acidobacteriota bacterium]